MEPTYVQQPAIQQRPVIYAGFWKRFLAYMIDSIILSFASLIFIIPLFIFIGIGSATDQFDDPSMGFLAIFIGMYFSVIMIVVVLHWLYFAFMESSRGATFGKMALGIRVTDMNGNQITFGRATGRYFARIISSLTFGIGYIMAGFSQQKQALHDIISGCLVVNKH